LLRPAPNPRLLPVTTARRAPDRGSKCGPIAGTPGGEVVISQVPGLLERGCVHVVVCDEPHGPTQPGRHTVSKTERTGSHRSRSPDA
jgi:hypothetical protein